MIIMMIITLVTLFYVISYAYSVYIYHIYKHFSGVWLCVWYLILADCHGTTQMVICLFCWRFTIWPTPSSAHPISCSTVHCDIKICSRVNYQVPFGQVPNSLFVFHWTLHVSATLDAYFRTFMMKGTTPTSSPRKTTTCRLLEIRHDKLYPRMTLGIHSRWWLWLTGTCLKTGQTYPPIIRKLD